MERRIYRILIIISILLSVYLYYIRESHTQLFVSLTLGLIFFLFSAGVHGLIAHSINPKLKNYTIAYPLLMGLFWCILVMILLFFIVPMYCPNFLIKG